MGDATSDKKVIGNILERLPGKFPRATIPDGVDPTTVALSVIQAFPDLRDGDFTDDAIWRDIYALTGTMRTFYSGTTVSSVWTQLAKKHNVSSAKVVPGSPRVVRHDDQQSAWVECRFVFTTSKPATECSGFLSLVPHADGQWKIWILRTILEQLSGQPNVDTLEECQYLEFEAANRANPEDDVFQGIVVNGTNGHKENFHFQAVIIGGGQAGLSTAGRLQALGVSYVVLEKNKQVGDAWRLRYDSAKLHTIREYAHLPFGRTFGPEYDEYLTKDDLADGHRKWAEKYCINVWLATTVMSARWDELSGLYSLRVRRNDDVLEISAKHVIFATGAGSQTPSMPQLPGRDNYQGIVMHSADYRSADKWKGKSGVVVGTANTGHDVADDMVEAGMRVTMVQRGRTYVLPVEYIEGGYKAVYNDKMPTEVSDRVMLTNPVSISRIVSSKAFHAMARAQPGRWAALEKAGFKVDPYGDIQHAINVRLGGHYIDIGTSAKIAKGLIKIKSDALLTGYTANGLVFSDGSEVKADVIVFATGFVGNLRQHVEEIFGKEIADRAGDCFGLNEEGEILGAFKPLKQPGLWYIGGTLGHARFYSRFVALSIMAEVIGTPLPVYTDCQYKLH
ncbi:hypothetical protein HRR83_001485 [Exophiala dermatitidis]|uniref:Dimethylaniline monooxygenase (N-oxide forming) n=2 Tax=Exophiala dermatitidis TaxID=5970 RepID=H6C699_EXODN|nr:dimethylaniline monooxygenase (N-oxide forming) [Exophiala dermatitidis NIH/UT8656]KAJ4522975.1 hypothetical protein HRR75_001371 [Exophiala dermatitidis]EHY59245.1 dimethylaniline monooxygenase (N-oxide forming) [Exophiala dermatitidis NIH/UT8656]KAJ4526294.1 hypothetical protein HRR74_001489 [Exophiala dermatitidis]KAJ4526763.1 hypothetical protein HRR73_001558 [Exophiala dermatitidis]KAJ4547022.1 hypothetical protein HRR77_004558 [Exophiala dermatitidis]